MSVRTGVPVGSYFSTPVRAEEITHRIDMELTVGTLRNTAQERSTQNVDRMSGAITDLLSPDSTELAPGT
jgi:hypothetical protein